jgi:hypothetical protein
MADAPTRTLVVSVASPPGLDDVDELARTCLGLRRLGGRLRVVASRPLLDLLVLAGLDAQAELVECELTCVAAVEVLPPT